MPAQRGGDRDSADRDARLARIGDQPRIASEFARDPQQQMMRALIAVIEVRISAALLDDEDRLAKAQHLI